MNTKTAGETRQFLRGKGHLLRKLNLQLYSTFGKKLTGIVYELKTHSESMIAGVSADNSELFLIEIHILSFKY